MKDFEEVQEFIDMVNSFDTYIWFKEQFLNFYTKAKTKTLNIDYSKVIKGISYDLETNTLFITFTSSKTYAYYKVPVDIFVSACFSDYVRETISDRDDFEEIAKNDKGLSLGHWFNEIVKGYFNYTLLN